jgi:hypothetical protein
VKKKLDKDLISELRNSKAKVGPLIPILVSSKTGGIVDGFHRIHTDRNWPKLKVSLDEKQTLIARLVLNTIRHPPESIDYDSLAATLAHEGTPRKRMVITIHELTGISPSTIRKHLNRNYLYGKGDELWDSLTRAARKQELDEKAAKERTSETELANSEEKPDAPVEEHRAGNVEAHEVEEPSVPSEAPLPKPPVEPTEPHHGFMAKLSSVCDAVEWIANTPSGTITKYYRALNSDQRIAAERKLQYVRENVSKITGACIE